MDWLIIVKYLHVVSAVCWVGGGVVLFFAGLLAEMRKDDTGTSSVLKLVVILSPIWFIPASLLTLIFGVIMAFGYGLWGEAWIILGLLGFLTTFSIGFFVLKPTSEAFTAHYEAGRHAEARTQGLKMLAVSKFDYVLLFTVIFDMVFRPSWSDIVPLIIIAIAVIGGAVLFLIPALTSRAQATA
jgi:uncharacterized membrane protein